MKYISLIAGIIGIVMMAIVAQAAEKTIAWDAVPAADGYRISISIDSGLTWQPAELEGVLIGDIPAGTTQVIVTLPDSGITLIRASSFNNISEVINTTNGVWFNSDWDQTSAPAALRSPGE